MLALAEKLGKKTSGLWSLSLGFIIKLPTKMTFKITISKKVKRLEAICTILASRPFLLLRRKNGARQGVYYYPFAPNEYYFLDADGNKLN